MAKKKPKKRLTIFFAWNDMVYGDRYLLILLRTLWDCGHEALPRYHDWVSKMKPWIIGKVIETDAPIDVLDRIRTAITVKHDFGNAIFVIGDEDGDMLEKVVSDSFDRTKPPITGRKKGDK